MLPLGGGQPVTLQRKIAAAILGIDAPIPSGTPSPMSEDEARWVRENVWDDAHRRIDGRYPYGFYRWCFCERGTCSNCAAGRHATCQFRTPKPSTDVASLYNTRGYAVAAVILQAGQRPCSRICPCDCPTPKPAAPPRPEAAQPPQSPGPGLPGQPALFD